MCLDSMGQNGLYMGWLDKNVYCVREVRWIHTQGSSNKVHTHDAIGVRTIRAPRLSICEIKSSCMGKAWIMDEYSIIHISGYYLRNTDPPLPSRPYGTNTHHSTPSLTE